MRRPVTPLLVVLLFAAGGHAQGRPQADDQDALAALARRDHPDPWLVANLLCSRGKHDAAMAFAKALSYQERSRGGSEERRLPDGAGGPSHEDSGGPGRLERVSGRQGQGLPDGTRRGAYAGVRVQVVFSGGGTDAAAFQDSGPRITPLAIPMRYTRSAVVMADSGDIEETVKLVRALADGA